MSEFKLFSTCVSFIIRPSFCLRLPPHLHRLSSFVNFCLCLFSFVSVYSLLSPSFLFCLRLFSFVSVCSLLSPYILFCLRLFSFVSACVRVPFSYRFLCLLFYVFCLFFSFPSPSLVSVCVRLSLSSVLIHFCLTFFCLSPIFSVCVLLLGFVFFRLRLSPVSLFVSFLSLFVPFSCSCLLFTPFVYPFSVSLPDCTNRIEPKR